MFCRTMSFHKFNMSCLSNSQCYDCSTVYELLMGSKINSTVYLTSNAYNRFLVFVIRLHWCARGNVYCGRTEECTQAPVEWKQPAGKWRRLLSRGSVFCSADTVQLYLPLFPIYFSNTCSKSDAMCSDIKQLLAFFFRYNNSNCDQC